MWSDILGKSSDDHTRYQTQHRADIRRPWSKGLRLICVEYKLERLRIRHLSRHVNHSQQQYCWYNELHLKRSLNFIQWVDAHAVSWKTAHKDAQNNSEGDQNKWVHKVWYFEFTAFLCTDEWGWWNDQSCAGWLCKGSKKVSAHACHVSYVVSDIVCDCSWVFGWVFI